MEQEGFRVSVEELAMVLSVEGQPQIAHDLLVAQLGEMEKQEADARLRAAGHALMARGWLVLGEEGQMYLATPLARVARVLSGASFSVRYGRSHRDAEFSLSYHFGDSTILEHKVEQGVVHHITEVQDTDSVIQGGLSFLEMDQTSPFTCPPSEVPYDLLRQIKDEDDISSVIKHLQKVGIPEETRTLLAEDLHQVRYRGSILRVEYGEDDVPRSDEGLLVLRGPERLWLLRILANEEERSVSLLPGTEQVFRREVGALLRTTS